jgi:hypothetical protein
MDNHQYYLHIAMRNLLLSSGEHSISLSRSLLNPPNFPSPLACILSFLLKSDIVWIRWLIGCALAVWLWIKLSTIKEGKKDFYMNQISSSPTLYGVLTFVVT